MGKRILKIYQSVAYQKPDVPCIMLQGIWLRDLGFEKGTKVVVDEGRGELVIRLLKETECDYEGKK